MSWKQGNWAEYVEPHFEGWTVVAENSYIDYQGSASVLAVRGNRVRLIQWDWGSCSYCDPYEDMSKDERTQAFSKLLMTMTISEFRSMVAKLSSEKYADGWILSLNHQWQHGEHKGKKPKKVKRSA